MDKILIRVDYEEEDLEIEGNICATGDEEYDKQQEQWVRDQLDRGNMFAWCWVRVTARCGSFVGTDSLGGVSYEKKEDLERDLLPDLKRSAIADMRNEMADALDRAREAKRLLPSVDKLPVEIDTAYASPVVVRSRLVQIVGVDLKTIGTWRVE